MCELCVYVLYLLAWEGREEGRKGGREEGRKGGGMEGWDGRRRLRGRGHLRIAGLTLFFSIYILFVAGYGLRAASYGLRVAGREGVMLAWPILPYPTPLALGLSLGGWWGKVCLCLC